MRKWLIGSGIAVVAVGLVVGGAAFAASRASAQQAQAAVEAPFQTGPIGELRGDGAELREVAGKLRDYMIQAVAGKLNLSTEELTSKLTEGQTLAEIAQAQGITEDALPALLKDARTEALKAAVSGGVLTQDQADWIEQHPALLRMLGAARMRGGWGLRGPRGRMGGGMMGWGFFGQR